MPPQSARLLVGDVAQFGAARFVIIGASAHSAVICEVIGLASDRHRADMPLDWPETLLMGVPTQSLVRCSPRLFRHSQRLRKTGAASDDLARRVRARALAEIETQRSEDAWLFARRLCF